MKNILKISSLSTITAAAIVPVIFSSREAENNNVSAVDPMAQQYDFSSVTFPHFEKYSFYGIEIKPDLVNKCLNISAHFQNHDVANGHFYLVSEYLNKTTTYQFNLPWGDKAFNFMVPSLQHNDNVFDIRLAFSDMYEWEMHPNDYDNFGFKHEFFWDYNQELDFNNQNLNVNDNYNWSINDGMFISFNDQKTPINNNDINFFFQFPVIKPEIFTYPINEFFSIRNAFTPRIRRNLKIDSISMIDANNNQVINFNHNYRWDTHVVGGTFLNLNEDIQWDLWTQKYNSVEFHTPNGIELPISGSLKPLVVEINLSYDNQIYTKHLQLHLQFPSFKSLDEMLNYYSQVQNTKDTIAANKTTFSFSKSSIIKYHNLFSKKDYFNLKPETYETN